MAPKSPRIKRSCEEQPEDDEQDESAILPFDENTSIAASSTPIIAATSTVTQRVSAKVVKLNTSDQMSPLLAGNVKQDSYRNMSGSNTMLSDGPDMNEFDIWMNGYIDDIKYLYRYGGVVGVLKKYYVHILVVIVAALATFSAYSVATANVAKSSDNMFVEYRSELAGLKRKFPELTKTDMQVLRLIGHQWLVDNSAEPIALTVAGSKSSNVIKHLLAITDKVTGRHRNSRGEISITENTERALLDARVSKALGRSSNSPNSVAILSIDRMTWEAPLVLHSYADHLSFPVSKALLLLSVDSEIDKSGNCDQQLDSVLTTSWLSKGGTEDNVPPVIARVTGYTICV